MYEMCCINKRALPYNEMYYIINLDIVCEHTLTFKSMGSVRLKNKQTNKQIVPYSKQGCLYLLKHTAKTSQVTYVTMVPRVGNETLRPLGVATGNALSVTRSEDTYEKTTCWPATAHDVTTGVPQYKCRREDTSSASSSEACVRSMAQSPGDAVSRSPLGEPWLHT